MTRNTTSQSNRSQSRRGHPALLPVGVGAGSILTDRGKTMKKKQTPKLRARIVERTIPRFAGDTPSISVVAYDPTESVDRHNHVAAWGLNVTDRDRKLAKRLRRAIEAGAVVNNLQKMTDTAGRTYWGNDSSMVLGRRMNADLKRLGY